MILLPLSHCFVISTAHLSSVTHVTKTSAAGINQTRRTYGTKEKVLKIHVRIPTPPRAPVVTSLRWHHSRTVLEVLLGCAVSPGSYSGALRFTMQLSLFVNESPSLTLNFLIIKKRSFFCPNVPLWKNVSSINQAFTRETLIVFWYAWFLCFFGGGALCEWYQKRKIILIFWIHHYERSLDRRWKCLLLLSMSCPLLYVLWVRFIAHSLFFFLFQAKCICTLP